MGHLVNFNLGIIKIRPLTASIMRLNTKKYKSFNSTKAWKVIYGIKPFCVNLTEDQFLNLFFVLILSILKLIPDRALLLPDREVRERRPVRQRVDRDSRQANLDRRLNHQALQPGQEYRGSQLRCHRYRRGTVLSGHRRVLRTGNVSHFYVYCYKYFTLLFGKVP